MTGTEKQLVSEQAVAGLWGQAPALLAWAEDNTDTSGEHDALEDHWTATELAEELAEAHEVLALRMRANNVVGPAKNHDRLARAARQLGAWHLNMIDLERALQAHFKRGCRRGVDGPQPAATAQGKGGAA